jgi:hypothetical protein
VGAASPGIGVRVAPIRVRSRDASLSTSHTNAADAPHPGRQEAVGVQAAPPPDSRNHVQYGQSTGVSRRRACRRRSPASPLTFIPPLSCLRDLLETRIRRKDVKEREPTAAEVSRRAGIDRQDFGTRRRGGGERAQPNVGSKGQAPQLALPARPRALHPPASVSRSYPPTYSPGTRLCPPIPPHRPVPHPYSHAGIPRAAARSTTPHAAACVSEVMLDISPRPLLPLVLRASRGSVLETLRRA